MKKYLLSLVVIISLSLLSIQQSHAGLPILYGNGLEFEQLSTLPDSVTVEGNHVNFGLSFDQFALFYIPIWNYGDVEYAVYAEGNNTVYPLEEDELEYLLEEYNLTVEDDPQLSFWNRVGGKLTLIGALLAILVFTLYRRAKNEAEQEQDIAEQMAKQADNNKQQ